MITFARRLFPKLLLAAASALFVLALLEITLRVVRPDLGDLAHSVFESHAYRIHSNPRSHRSTRLHPDTGRSHVVINNEHGFRQHRSFPTAKPEGTLRVGVFGDSFTENLRLPVQYSLSEPLDWILNRAGLHADVLNFAVAGYGTDQSYLQYRDDSAPYGLDWIVYVFCDNDVRDIMANGLFDLDADGKPAYRPRKTSNVFIRAAARMYTTYFVLGGLRTLYGGFDPLALRYDRETIVDEGQERRNRETFSAVHTLAPSPETDRALRILSALLAAWRDETRKANQRFLLVLLPREPHKMEIVSRIARRLDIRVLNLWDAAMRDDIDPSTLFFINDSHWNERGNALAAIEIARVIAESEAIPVDDAHFREALGHYYAGFVDGFAVGRFEEFAEAESVPPADLRHEILGRYLALESARRFQEEP